jgi:hypothetical protein
MIDFSRQLFFYQIKVNIFSKFVSVFNSRRLYETKPQFSYPYYTKNQLFIAYPPETKRIFEVDLLNIFTITTAEHQFW